MTKNVARLVQDLLLLKHDINAQLYCIVLSNSPLLPILVPPSTGNMGRQSYGDCLVPNASTTAHVPIPYKLSLAKNRYKERKPTHGLVHCVMCNRLSDACWDIMAEKQ